MHSAPITFRRLSVRCIFGSSLVAVLLSTLLISGSQHVAFAYSGAQLPSSSSAVTLASTSHQKSAHKAHKKAKPATPLFDLTNLQGQKVTDATLRGKPVLVVFGYTFCPDACPTGLQNLSQFLDLLGDDSSKVHAVFITLDPQRDTEEKLKNYLNNFHPSIIGLRGTPEQTAAAAKALHITFSKAESVGDTDYEMDYSPVFTVLDSKGRIAEKLDSELPPEDLLKSLQKYIPEAQ